MASGMQFTVSGNKAEVKDKLYNLISQNEWRVTPKGDFDAIAEHGSKAGSFWGGSLAGKKGRYLVLQINLLESADGNTDIKLIGKSSGFSGGFIGMGQAKAVYSTLFNTIEAALTNAGVLVNKANI